MAIYYNKLKSKDLCGMYKYRFELKYKRKYR